MAVIAKTCDVCKSVIVSAGYYISYTAPSGNPTVFCGPCWQKTFKSVFGQPAATAPNPNPHLGHCTYCACTVFKNNCFYHHSLILVCDNQHCIQRLKLSNQANQSWHSQGTTQPNQAQTLRTWANSEDRADAVITALLQLLGGEISLTEEMLEDIQNSSQTYQLEQDFSTRSFKLKTTGFARYGSIGPKTNYVENKEIEQALIAFLLSEGKKIRIPRSKFKDLLLKDYTLVVDTEHDKDYIELKVRENKNG